MAKSVGTYFFKKYHMVWGIWVIDELTNSGMSANFVKSVVSFDEAVKETYRMNGWGEPKRIKREY